MALSIAMTSAVAGLTFMTVTESAASQAISEEYVDTLSLPGAGLSTEILLSSINSNDIYVNFISVSSVAQENISQQEAAIAQIEEDIAKIEMSVASAKSCVDEYSSAQEAYSEVCEALSDAQDALEKAREADTYILADMYAQDVEELTLKAEQLAADAQDAAQAQKEEEAAAASSKKSSSKTTKTTGSASSSTTSSSTASASETASSSDADAVRQSLVNYALSFVGVTPYKYGGTSLSGGVDCSGFTMAIYAKYGYSLSHSSSSQAYAGRSVSLSEIKVGDLVCYSGHVGIYIGNGQIVHAPGPGRCVTVASMYIMNIKCVRRIIE